MSQYFSSPSETTSFVSSTSIAHNIITVEATAARPRAIISAATSIIRVHAVIALKAVRTIHYIVTIFASALCWCDLGSVTLL